MSEPISLAIPGCDCLRVWRIRGAGQLPIIRTVTVAGTLRAALIRLAEQQNGSPRLPVALHGQPRSDGIHAHAFYLPEDRNGDGHIDHLAIFAPGGFCSASVRLLDGLQELRISRAGQFRLSVHPRPEILYPPSRAWLSTTPFLGPRHAWRSPGRVRRGREVTAQLRHELKRLRTASGQSLPAAEVCPVRPFGIPRASAFTLGSRFDKAPSHPVRGWFAVEFPRPVHGPLALGVGAHFGLGQLRPFLNAAACPL